MTKDFVFCKLIYNCADNTAGFFRTEREPQKNGALILASEICLISTEPLNGHPKTPQATDIEGVSQEFWSFDSWTLLEIS